MPVTPVTPVTPGPEPVLPVDEPESEKTRFFSSIDLDPEKYNSQIAKINEMIIDQLRFNHAHISLTLEIDATQPDGFDASIVNSVTNSADKLGFKSSNFEEE